MENRKKTRIRDINKTISDTYSLAIFVILKPVRCMEMVGELIVFYDYTFKFAVLFWVTFYDLALDSRIINHSRMLSRLFYFFKSAVKKKRSKSHFTNLWCVDDLEKLM